jgi:hypothetical protein
MLRSRFCSIVAAGALAFGAITLTTTAANAVPKQTEAEIKAGCKSAGGTYAHDSASGISSCIYKDINGTQYVDHYVDGVWIPRDDETGPQDSKPLPPAGVSQVPSAPR